MWAITATARWCFWSMAENLLSFRLREPPMTPHDAHVCHPLLSFRTEMANIKSQIKRNRQNEARRQRNKSERSRLRTLTKRLTDAVESGDQDAAQEAYQAAAQAYDKAAAKGIIHKNKASNKKSRLAKKLTSA
jgi:small subunit ribosomal protein S20